MALQDPRVVLTLDAGGTNLVFSAIRGETAIAEAATLPAPDLHTCLDRILAGFDALHERTLREAAALSLAFPGPADYREGIVGDLRNLSAFRGGVALGAMLEDRFGLPVFFNNDGDLFALGEARFGLLPWVNARLAEAGSPKRFRNLLGLTLGTGFGAGIVLDGRLLLGDNGAAAEIWLLRNKLDADSFAEEGVGVRAIRREYARGAGIAFESAPDPKTIAAIARLEERGDAHAARESFRRMGEVAGDAVAHALALIDGLVVLGGGLAGAAPLFLPALVNELNGPLRTLEGARVDRLPSRAFCLDDPGELASFLRGGERTLAVPRGTRAVRYDPGKRIGAGVAKLGTARATALGAASFALDALDRAAAADPSLP